MNRVIKGKMDSSNYYQAILSSLVVPVVFVDTSHVIRYLNPAGVKQYAKYGNLLNKSIFDCHSTASQGKILEIFGRLEGGLEEALYAENEKERVYMRAVRDCGGKLLGYYERFEAKTPR